MNDEPAPLPQPFAAAEETPPTPPFWWQLKLFCEAFDNAHGLSENGYVSWNVIMWHLMSCEEQQYLNDNILAQNEDVTGIQTRLQQYRENRDFLTKLVSFEYPRLSNHIFDRIKEYIKNVNNAEQVNSDDRHYLRETIFWEFEITPQYLDSMSRNLIILESFYIQKIGGANNIKRVFLQNNIFLNGIRIENSYLELLIYDNFIFNKRSSISYRYREQALIFYNSNITNYHQNETTIILYGIYARKSHIYSALTGFISESFDFHDCHISCPRITANSVVNKLDFLQCIFLIHTEFSKNSILKNSNFTNSTFKLNADFSNVTFTGAACFDDVTFEGQAIFDGSVFHRYATFKTAKFKKSASFKGAKFLCHELAENDKGQRIDTLSPSFISAEFSEVANFKESRFDAPPHFEGAKVEVLLLEGSKFHNCTTKKDAEGNELLNEHGKPIPMKKGDDLAASAWSALMIITEKVQNTRKRIEFHNNLLEVERKDTTSFTRFFYDIYKVLGEGRFETKPLNHLVFLVIMMGYIYFLLYAHHLFSPHVTQPEPEKERPYLCKPIEKPDTLIPLLRKTAGYAIEMSLHQSLPLIYQGNKHLPVC